MASPLQPSPWSSRGRLLVPTPQVPSLRSSVFSLQSSAAAAAVSATILSEGFLRRRPPCSRFASDLDRQTDRQTSLESSCWPTHASKHARTHARTPVLLGCLLQSSRRCSRRPPSPLRRGRLRFRFCFPLFEGAFSKSAFQHLNSQHLNSQHLNFQHLNI